MAKKKKWKVAPSTVETIVGSAKTVLINYLNNMPVAKKGILSTVVFRTIIDLDHLESLMAKENKDKKRMVRK